MELQRMNKNEAFDNDFIFSKSVSAGKRIYYLDVKQNRKGELFLIITESKKIILENDPQNVHFEKHKIFLYKEDFDKFTEAMNETLDFIKKNNPVVNYETEQEDDWISIGKIEDII